MDEGILRLLLELPLREHVRRSLQRPPPSLADPRLDEIQVDLMEGVIREVIDGLDLTSEQRERGLALAAAALRRAAGESEHHDQMVSVAGGHQALGSHQR